MDVFPSKPAQRWPDRVREADGVAKAHPITIVAEGGARDAVIAALKQFGAMPSCFNPADGVIVSVVISK